MAVLGEKRRRMIFLWPVLAKFSYKTIQHHCNVPGIQNKCICLTISLQELSVILYVPVSDGFNQSFSILHVCLLSQRRSLGLWTLSFFVKSSWVLLNHVVGSLEFLGFISICPHFSHGKVKEISGNILIPRYSMWLI